MQFIVELFRNIILNLTPLSFWDEWREEYHYSKILTEEKDTLAADGLAGWLA